MHRFRLHDWNDVRLLLACAKLGSFAKAAASLGLDQATVSRRVGLLEDVVGRPLFHRRHSGATPTQAGLALLERAAGTQDAINDFEATLIGLSNAPPPTVTIGASEGLLTYTLIPVLLGSSATEQPLDGSRLRRPLPDLAFTTVLSQADIAVVATGSRDLPPVEGAIRVRKVGSMHFIPVVGRALLEANGGSPEKFDELSRQPILDIDIYKPIGSLEPWNDLVTRCGSERVTTTGNSQTMHKLLVEGRGFGIFPSYSPLYDERITPLEIPGPSLVISLWLVAHEDRLREPEIRYLYDGLAQMFSHSPWFC